MKLKKTLVTLTITLFLSSMTACSSNQAKPSTKTTEADVISKSESSNTAETTTSAELPQPVIAKQSRGSSQSAGGRLTLYVVKVVVSAAVTYFVTKAIVDYVKDDLTGED